MADPPDNQKTGSAAGSGAVVICDFCGVASARSERQRLMWETEADGELVLADLCARCASDADRLLDAYGVRGRASLRVSRPGTAEATGLMLLRRTSGALIRTAVYVLIALATFFVITLITARH
jgi:hypothetical protein